MNKIIKHLNDGTLSVETMKTMIINLNEDIKIISFMIKTKSRETNSKFFTRCKIRTRHNNTTFSHFTLW